MDDHQPIILLRGSLSPSTISLSSPNLDLTTITLNLELCLRNCSGPITVLTRGSFLSSRAQSHYSSTYRLYDTETDSNCSACVTTSCWSGGNMIIKNPEEELLELGTLNASESGTDKAPADTDTPRDSPHQQSYEQLSLNIKVDIGIHKEHNSTATTTNSSNKPTGTGEAAERGKDGTSSSQSQPKQQFSKSDLSVCATQLSSLVPGRQYQVRVECAPGRGPFYFWWWSQGTKADIIANSNKRGPTGLLGPVTLPSTGQPIYAVQRMGVFERTIRVEMVEYPVLTVTA